MAAGGHFGCPKITFDRISGHFRSICNLNLFFINHFWSHLWPFQIDTQFKFLNFGQNGGHRPFWTSKIHFWSHFCPFQIDRPFTFNMKTVWILHFDKGLVWNLTMREHNYFGFWIAHSCVSFEKFFCSHYISIPDPRGSLYICIYNKATRSPEISRQQVQKLTPQLLFFYIYWI